MMAIKLIPEIDFYTRVLVGILGISFPILFQLISKLDDKYSSLIIVEIFNKEKVVNRFIIALLTSIFACIIWSLKLHPIVDIGKLQFLLNNSADIFVAVSTIFLLIFFFQYVYKIRIYYIASKFIAYLMDKHKSEPNNLQYFEAIGDIYLHSIKKENEKLALTIYRFYSEEYRKIRDQTNDREVKYPEIYYIVHHKAVEEIAALGNRRSPLLESRIASNNLLMGGNGTGITSETFSWIWENINTALRYKRDELIMHHWKSAHQICNLSLNKYNYGGTDTDDVKKYKALVREQFLEFHTALGGLLLYLKRYECLDALLTYTTSDPPSYELIPQGMHIIFPTFFKFIDPYYRNFSFISGTYSFPGADGMRADGLVKKWIAKYITLVFIRQYTLNVYFTYDKHTFYPDPPKSQFEKRFWINKLEYFSKLLSENLSNKELLSSLNYSFITDEWCNERKVDAPIKFISNYKIILENDFENTEITQTVSAEKEKLFLDLSGQIFEKTLDDILKIGNSVAANEYNSYFIEGTKLIQSKDGFSDNPEVSHFDAETALSSFLSKEIRKNISYTFKLSSSKRFLFRIEELFNAVNALKLTDNYIIVTFGLNVKHYSQILNNDLDNNYNGIPIFHFDNYIDRAPTLFILNKSDLPKIEFNETEDETIKKYNLTKTSKLLNLYASIIDLFTKPDLIEENAVHFEKSQLLKSVLLCLIIKIEVKWGKVAKVLQFSEYSQYLQEGLPNKVDDIKDFTLMFGKDKT